MSDQPMPPMTPQMQPAQPHGPLKTGLAVTALVFGIVSLFVCPLLGIVAIITGIIAINRASSAPHLHGGKGMAIAGLVCGGDLPLPGLIALVVRRTGRRRILCARNRRPLDTPGLWPTVPGYARRSLGRRLAHAPCARCAHRSAHCRCWEQAPDQTGAGRGALCRRSTWLSVSTGCAGSVT